MTLSVVLTGTFRRPELRFEFPWGARMPRGGDAQKWIKDVVPSRRWDPAEKAWYITGTGINPDKFFAKHGIEVDYSEATGDLEDLDSLEPLWRPMVQRSKRFPHSAFVRHRLAGYERVSELLGPGAVWDKKAQRFTALITDLIDENGPKKGLSFDDDTFNDAVAALQAGPIPANVREAARELAASTGVDGDEQKVLSERTRELVDIVASHTGYLPKWFGLDLFPFQVAGAYAIVGGHRALCDAPGLGKTRQALAAAAIRRAERVVIVVPPLVVTNWCREALTALGPFFAPDHKQASVATLDLTAGKKKTRSKAPDFPPYIVPIRAGKKVPPFPDRGVIVVADSLLASRPELLKELVDWNPEAALFDEIHRARNFSTARATADRNLACTINDLRIPITGTPFLASPAEVTNLLAIAGALEPYFGGASKFMNRYTKQNRFGAFLPRREMLSELEMRMTRDCWVRRNKADVLKQLPKKLRTTRIVDIDTRGFHEAHEVLYEKIREWVKEFTEDGSIIGPEDIKKFSRERIDLITPLRAAAGVAKVPAAIEIVTDWMEQTTETAKDGTKKYTRPLVVWVHHQPVMEALVNSIPADLAGVGFIDGGVPEHKRQPMADKLQNGEIGVLFCSIGAAGFGITLTRSSDAIFVETDWTPANISQAEDRIHRIGQTETCIITTLMAVNTLDPHMRAILRNKANDLNVLMPGADNNVTEMTAAVNEDEGIYEETAGDDPELEKQFKSLADIMQRIVEDIVREQDAGVRKRR
ncbi:DEAD/DEAH box helicase [Arthrobacter sp. zg-Y1110]|uniref:SNF2-related protein n=1 Tax=Arthrobacter sp. zg-Y1110 TaxID=2886932 RepID=UPI001D152C1F|nr:DEAD/DEAH box helicase [Arthrobacter sp. zg-Y1110]MCC3292834.1 DEAD/DEAH box helicase [Arthrobacter sp. zg-Y1110]UWX86773.1 DEAD/DEAH box helicase [Arthrobacter sp. zg-Y1110]